MNIPTHPLQIGTLAIWLSVSIAGVTGLFLHPGHLGAREQNAQEFDKPLSDLVIGTEKPSDNENDPPSTDTASSSEEIQVTQNLPSPPPMPVTAQMPPLPDIPDMPVRPTTAQEPSIKSAPTTRSASTASSRTPAPRKTPGNNSSAGTHRTGGSGMSVSARMAAGIMPAPSYPPEARRKGQTGTVLVEFTVDTSGLVISAYAKNPSPWPLLNEEAVRTVRSWKFPPGGIIKLQRPIVFQLR